MANPEVSNGRRRFLTATTAVVGAVGAGFAAVPFIKSWQPSARAQGAGAPVSVDISKLEFGQRLDVPWRGKPVWVIRRNAEQLDHLAEQNERQIGRASCRDRVFKYVSISVVAGDVKKTTQKNN